ncbi:hypothetical protein ACIBLA_26875 [Streptomyces sp. NPDC050433]|uniref:hypothetical protein n=1 Tax=Streptomyces sp. NPDC050433 TaxID=3365615 RepID=UPI00378978AC
MNFVKRAALSLVARRAKTALLLGIFLVICTLLLGGFLLQGATSRQEAEAQRRIGVDVTVRGEGLTLATADAGLRPAGGAVQPAAARGGQAVGPHAAHLRGAEAG